MGKEIGIFGSTGSIGVQTLEVVDAHPEMFKVAFLTAHSNYKLLAEQAIKYMPEVVVITDESKFNDLKSLLSCHAIEVRAGKYALEDVAAYPGVELVITAIVGYAGLRATLAAIEDGKDIGLANKETLVVAGDLVTSLAKEKGVKLLPVDSEHSAIFQCLVGEESNPIEKIILTASGGPFRGKTKSELAEVTLEQALKHPNWEMGAKITIDSSTLMNKGLEVIEAKWLFDLSPDQIEVVVHAQSIIHSYVQFEDGSLKAQIGLPDMKLPIQYAMAYPHRMRNEFPRFNVFDYPQLTFERPDLDAFPCLNLAFKAMKKGGNAACILNAANEVAVDAFLNGKIQYLDIPKLIEQSLDSISFIHQPSLEDYEETDSITRSFVLQQIN